MPPLSNTRMRLGRLVDERERNNELIEDIRGLAEEETRDLNDGEAQQIERYRGRVGELDEEIAVLAADLERADASQDVSRLLRPPEERSERRDTPSSPNVYRTFAAFARDALIVRYPVLASAAAGPAGAIAQIQENARERLDRAIQHTLTSDVEGLLPPTHMAQIMDLIGASRPVVETARKVNLTSGRLTYPQIVQRPEVLKQSAEKTEAGTANMQVDMGELIADTYLGGGNLSWQTLNWTTPDALQLWFDLAAEQYARATETAACDELGSAAGGTTSPPLGTTGTEDFAAWRKAVITGISSIFNTTGGRARTNTLYLAADRFFSLAGIGTDQTLQVSAVGALNIESMTGTWSGLRVVGSYGFDPGEAIVGDSNAFLVGETPGAPVELRAVEPAIGGMEVGLIGAFRSKVFDPDRFVHLS